MDPCVLLDPMTDAHGRVVDVEYAAVNRAAERYMHATEDSLLGRRLRERWPGEGAEIIVGWVAQVVASGEDLSLDSTTMTSAVTHDQRRFDVRVVGTGHGVLMTWRDVTQRHEMVESLRSAEARYRLLAEHSADVVVQADDQYRITYVSPPVSALLGWLPSELIGSTLVSLVHPDDLAAAAEARERLERESRVGGPVRARLRRKDGGWQHVSSTASELVDEAGRRTGVIGTWRDASADVAAREALESSEARYRLLADASADVVIEVGPDWRATYVSPAITGLLGYQPEELVGELPLTLGHPDDAGVLAAARRRMLDHGSFTTPVLARLRRKDGGWRWVASTARLLTDAHGAPIGAVAHWRDAEAEVAATTRLEERASTDALTGLLTRHEGWRRLGASLADERRAGGDVAVLFCDLDGFKEVNDDRGHQVGDVLLTAVATRVRQAVRDSDYVVRIGGDEMLVVLDGVADPGAAVDDGEKVRAAVALPMSVDDTPVRVTASIGVAVADGTESIADLVHRADDAMYEAKEQGKDRVVLAGRR